MALQTQAVVSRILQAPRRIVRQPGRYPVVDRIVVPPNLRTSILQDLHSCHLGVDKMKSLTHQTVWWPELHADISAFVSKCARCLFKKPSVKPSSWTLWQLTYMPWQRIHADYCGPFLKQYYALILIDSYSKWPEVFLTTKADGAFTKLAMRRMFSREGTTFYIKRSTRLVGIDWLPACIYRSSTCRVQRLSGNRCEDTEERR